MNDDLDRLDARARAAADDLRRLASARPAPDVEPNRLATPLPSRTRSRRPLAIAAAALLLVGGAVGVATMGGDEDPDQTRAATSAPARPFVAEWTPSDLAFAGVYSPEDASRWAGSHESFLGQFHVYGDDGTAVAGIGIGLSVDELGASGERVTVDGRELVHVSSAGWQGAWTVVPVGDRSIVAVGPTLDEAVRDRLALGARLDGDRLVVDPAAVGGWTRLAVLEDAAAAAPGASVSGVARLHGYGASYIGIDTGSSDSASEGDGGASDETGSGDDDGSDGDSSVRMLAVGSVATSSDASVAIPLFLPDHRATEVRGHDAQIASGSFGTPPSIYTVVSWEERAGETLTVSGIGLTEDEILRVAAGLRPVAEDEWTELRRDTRLGRFADAFNRPGVDVVELASDERDDGVVWRLTWAEPSDDHPTELVLDISNGRAGSSSSSTPGTPPFSALVTTASGDLVLAAGLVDDTVARLTVERPDGTLVSDLEVREVEGLRVWVTEVTEDRVVVVARDASGAELGSQTVNRSDGSIYCSQSEGADGGEAEELCSAGSSFDEPGTAVITPVPGEPPAN